MVNGYNLVKELCINNLGVGCLPLYAIKKEVDENKLSVLNLDGEKIRFGYFIKKDVNNKVLKEFVKFIN